MGWTVRCLDSGLSKDSAAAPAGGNWCCACCPVQLAPMAPSSPLALPCTSTYRGEPGHNPAKFKQNAEKRACFWPAFLQRQAKAAVDSTMWCFHPSMPNAASPSALSFSIFLSTVNRKAEKLERMQFSSIPGWWPAGPRGARAFSKIQRFGLKSWKGVKVERWKGGKVERWKDGKVEKSIDAWLTGQPASEERKHFQKHFGGQKVKSQKVETSINAHHWWFRLFHSRSRLLLFAHPRNARGLHGSCTLKPASSLANSTCWRSWWHACGM